MRRREERFLNDAQLLTSKRPDGTAAIAADTGNRYTYSTAVGWVPSIPTAGAFEARPLVYSQETGKAEFDTPNRLIPPGGAAGQLVGVDTNEQTSLGRIVASSSIALPVNFATGSATQVASFTIPGGSVGPNGFVHVTVMALVLNSSGARTYTAYELLNGLAYANDMITPSFSADAVNSIWIVYERRVLMQDAEIGFPTFVGSLESQKSSGLSQSRIIDAATPSGGTELDTTLDWTFDVYFQASGVVTGSAQARGVSLDYGYAP